MTLFTPGEFTSHSGLRLPFKIDCDALTDEDLDTLARYYVGPDGRPGGRYVGQVVGIPRGGLRFATALCRHLDLHPRHAYTLVADDVLTTGASFEDWRSSHRESYVHGVVIFARGPCPAWVTPLFTLTDLGATR